MTNSIMQEKVSQSVEYYINLASNKLNHTFKIPEISYNLRGTTAGQAWYSKWLIKINMVLLTENFDDMIQNTIGHEVAHLIARSISNYRIKPHGHEWKSVMRLLGLNPTRCHNYNTDNSKVRTVKRIPYVCETCGMDYNLTKIRHNKILKGVKYRCCKCRGKIIQK